MSINNILNPDEYEFYEYLIHNHVDYFKDFIDINHYHIDFVGMIPKDRTFIIGFNPNKDFPHENPDMIISFKVQHNHGNFLVYDINLEKNKLKYFEDFDLFVVMDKKKYQEVVF